jgi:uncharacterized protein (TIGR03382 family)
MTNQVSRIVVVVSVAALGVGCGGVHNIPVEETASDLAAAICTKAYDCCSTEQLMKNMDLTGTTEAQCEDATADKFRNALQSIQFSVDRKRSAYEPDKVDACLRSLRGSDCATLNTTNHLSGVPDCDSFTTPRVALGGGCTYDFECVDSWCKQPPQGTLGDGTCTAFTTGETSCADSSQAHCAPGEYCHPGRDRCVHAGDEGADCGDAYDCKTGVCGGSTGDVLTCQPPKAPGPMCFYESGCSAAGGRPGGGTIILLVLFAGVAIIRARRATQRMGSGQTPVSGP